MSTLDGREPVVPASGTDAQAPEPTPSNGWFIRGNWTPGPYRQCENSTGYFVEVVGGGHTFWLARVQVYKPLAEECQANINLFAAAPELAEIVRRALACGCLNGHLLKAAQDAYSKALGLAGSSAPSPEPATAEKKEGN